MTGTVLKIKNKIITVPLLLKLIVRERRRKEGKEEEIRKRKREGRKKGRRKRREEGVDKN